MRTGFDMIEEDTFTDAQMEFLRKTVAIMKVLTKEALKTSERFCKACGRNYVTGNDMYYALMFESHAFFEKDFDEDFFRELEIERQHTYNTDDEESDDDESEMEEGEDTGIENYSTLCVNESEKEFHTLVIKYASEWKDWFPEDPVKQLMKSAIDKTKQNVPMT